MQACNRRIGFAFIAELLEGSNMELLGAIIIGFLAGIIAKLITPGHPKPQGFILTTVLGIVGAVVAKFLGEAIGLYGPGDSAGFIGAIVGAVIILLIWRQLAPRT
jgi:uncharacterized membrane protein YeaQ/YmgE (transglycosylase-associated protein family)